MLTRGLQRTATRGVQAAARRFFATEAQSAGNAAAEAKGAPTLPKSDDYYSAKAKILKSSFLLKAALFTTGAITAAATVESFLDFEPVNKLSAVTHMIRHSNEHTVLEGLNSLNQCFYITKRVFSGPVSIPLSSNVVESHEPQLVTALMNAAGFSGQGIRWKSLSWLFNLTKSQPSVRSQIVLLEKIPELATLATSKAADANQHHEWLLAANVLIAVVADSKASGKMSSRDRDAVDKTISTLSSRSNDPLALMAAAKLSEAAGGAVNEGFGGKTGADQLAHATRKALAPIAVQQQVDTGAGLVSIAGLSAFASVWGSFLWRARAMRLGVNGVKGINQWLRTRRVGLKFGLVLSLDFFAQQLMRFSSTENFSLDVASLDKTLKSSSASALINTNEVVEVVKRVNSQFATDRPPALSSVFPMAQIALFGVTSLWLVRSSRFVFVPFAIALAYNHRDCLKSNDSALSLGNAAVSSTRNFIAGLTSQKK